MRRPQPSEYGSVRALIGTVANETFKDLFAPNPVPLKFEDEDWPLAWVAVSDEKIVGVIITNQEWVSDLWVFREHRRQGVGSRLLAQGEAEIAARGHQTGRLRVVRSNAVAVQFYLSQGGRLRVSSRTRSITMPCWRWLSLCRRSSVALSERIVGNSYLGITSGLPVIRLEPTQTCIDGRQQLGVPCRVKPPTVCPTRAAFAVAEPF